jgi:hypothetical protein
VCSITQMAGTGAVDWRRRPGPGYLRGKKSIDNNGMGCGAAEPSKGIGLPWQTAGSACSFGVKRPIRETLTASHCAHCNRRAARAFMRGPSTDTEEPGLGGLRRTPQKAPFQRWPPLPRRRRHGTQREHVALSRLSSSAPHHEGRTTRRSQTSPRLQTRHPRSRRRSPPHRSRRRCLTRRRATSLPPT